MIPSRGLFLSPYRLLCAMGLLAIFSSTMSKSPVLPLFANSLGAPAAIVGLIAAASTVVGIVTSLPAGALSDFLGRRRVILLSAFIFASAPFLYLLITSAWHLVLVRVYHGFATAIFEPVALALVADLSVARRGERMGWYSSATLVGRAAAPFVGGLLLTLFAASLFWHYRMVYLVCGLAGTIALFMAFGLPRSRGGDGPRKNEGEGVIESEREIDRFRKMLGGLSTVVKHRGILFTSSVEAVQYLGFAAYEVFLPLYAMLIGIRGSLIGVLLGVEILSLMVTRPLMGKLSDRYGRSFPIVMGLALGGLELGVIPFLQTFWPLFLLSFLMGVSMASVTASTSALVADFARGAYGSALGVMGTVKDIGQSLGPIAAGLLIGAFDYRPAFFAIGGVMLITSLLFHFLVGGAKRYGGEAGGWQGGRWGEKHPAAMIKN